MTVNGHTYLSDTVGDMLVNKYGKLNSLMIISTSKYAKTNGDNPILLPLQMISKAGVMTGQGNYKGG